MAGPALAYWLSRYGFQPTIVERAPTVRPGGYAVDFRGASVRALERMGLLKEVQAKQTRVGAITIVDRNNRKLASMPDGFTSGEIEILRGDLAAVLYKATCKSTEYIFDDSIDKINQTDAGIDVQFQRSGPRRFDLVVGADGLHSKVRSLVFGDEAEFLRYLGYYVSIFSIPNYLGRSEKDYITARWVRKSASLIEAIASGRRPRSSLPLSRWRMTVTTQNSSRRSCAITSNRKVGKCRAF